MLTYSRTKFSCIVVILLATILQVSSVNFYADLGVDRRASSRDIRRAFRQLALKYHPDRNPDDPEAEQKFLKIAKAYEVLSDPESRRRYDLPGGSEEYKQQSAAPTSSHRQHTQYAQDMAAEAFRSKAQDAIRHAQQMHEEAMRRAQELHQQHMNAINDIHFGFNVPHHGW